MKTTSASAVIARSSATASLAASLLLSCAPASEPSAAEAERIVAEVRAAVDAFAQAERDLDPEAALSFIAPGFTMYGDGQPAGYAEVAEGMPAFLRSLRRFDTTWSDIEVRPLGRDHALVSLVFHDEIEAADGTVTRQWGPNTFVWQRFGERWQIIYTDADHYDVEVVPPSR